MQGKSGKLFYSFLSNYKITSFFLFHFLLKLYLSRFWLIFLSFNKFLMCWSNMFPTLCHVIFNSVHQFTLLFVNIFVVSFFVVDCCCCIEIVVVFTLLELGAGDFEVDGIGSEDILSFDIFSVVGELNISPTHFF